MSTSITPVVSAATQILAHTPEMARYGSKPSRELSRDPAVKEKFLASLRSFEEAVAYAPHQAYLGSIHPREMPERPWTKTLGGGSGGFAGPQEKDPGAVPANPPEEGRFAPDGEIMPEHEFLGLLAAVDDFGLIKLSGAEATEAVKAFESHPFAGRLKAGGPPPEPHEGHIEEGGVPLYLGKKVAGYAMPAHPQDPSLAADVLLENLANKATATLALLHMLERRGIDPAEIEYVLSCSEEAVGDRYQRGGGNMAKAVAEAANLKNASGADIKNFCAAPIPAMVIAASLVSSGVFRKVAVVSGGSLPKLGMKFQGHLKNDLPVLEDVLGGAAFLVEADDGSSPRVRLDVVGRHTVGAGGSNPQIMQALVIDPLQRAGLKMTDVDDYATELHNPEITEPQGSGNVPERNYKTIAALGVQQGELQRDQIASFVTERGMPGFAPTQGHLASAICYLPAAVRRLENGDAQRAMLLAKGSLFLGRMSQMSDGMSVLLERR